jgi:hypothetical protein
VIVVKVGGSLGIDYDAVCSDLASIVKAGRQAILVHGGLGRDQPRFRKAGKPPRMVTSVSGYESRYTDRETLEIFEMVYCWQDEQRHCGEVTAKWSQCCWPVRTGWTYLGGCAQGYDHDSSRLARKKCSEMISPEG